MSNFRITTGGLYRNYRTNLYKNNQKLTDAMLGVETQRKFNTYAEDPAAASKAWRLRRSYWRTGDQIDNSNYIISKYESAYSAMTAIVDGDAGSGQYGLSLDSLLSAVEGASGSAGSSRSALGKELFQTAENIVSMMNSKYGDEYIFAGADGANMPFTWSEDGKLLYRGMDVNLEQPKDLSDFGLSESDLTMAQPQESDYTKENGLDEEAFAEATALYEEMQEKISAFEQYKADYLQSNGVSYEQGIENYAKLDAMAKETTYVDIGIGMLENERGELINGSAFNSAVSGLDFLGYGKDNNLVMVIRELGTIFSNADPDTGVYANGNEDAARVDELLNKLHENVRSAQDQHVQLSADAKYLRTNLGQLETVRNELDKQIVDVEDLDMAEAITNMTWAQYCYNAALRIGNDILSQSLIDYMS